MEWNATLVFSRPPLVRASLGEAGVKGRCNYPISLMTQKGEKRRKRREMEMGFSIKQSFGLVWFFQLAYNV